MAAFISKRTRKDTHRPTIGYLTTEIERDWALWPWHGIVDAARNADMNVVSFIGKIVAWPHYSIEQANIIFDLIDAERLDGLIIWTSGLLARLSEPEQMLFCSRPGLPVVTLEGSIEGMPCITYENYRGMRTAMDHLIEVHKYNRIGFVGYIEHHIGFQERYRAYKDALAAHGLSLDPALVKWFPDDAHRTLNTVDEGMFRAWFTQAKAAGVQALVGVCDSIAIQIVESLQHQGLRIPEDMGIVGFDDFTESRVVTPPLTTVNPSWYEFGTLAIETLAALMEGAEVPAVTVVPAKLAIRESCGCIDPAVALAGAGSPARKPSGAPRMRRPENLAREMVQAAQASSIEGIEERVGSLVECFEKEASGAITGQFLGRLSEVLRLVISGEGEMATWQDFISLMRREMLPRLGEKAKERAENLWQQARVMIAKLVERVQVFERVRAEQRVDRLSEVGQALIATFDMAGLTRVLAAGLPGIGILGCYLSLYEDPRPYKYGDSAPEWSRLMLAYGAHGPSQLDPDGMRFMSRKLAPDEVWPRDRQFSIVAEPLYFQEEQIGFALFEVGPRQGGVYEVLRGQIASALKGALLIRQGEKRSRQSQTVAEVGAVLSKSLGTSDLLQTVVDLTQRSFELHQVHIYVISEKGDALVLASGASQDGRKLTAGEISIPLSGELSSVARTARSRQVLLLNADSELVVPLTAGERLLGVLYVDLKPPGRFTQEDAQTHATLAAQISVALENARLFEETRRADEKLRRLAKYDELTGLPNRTYFREWVARMLGEAKRRNAILALLFMDLNRFKSVNDSLGHEAGDELLREVAARLAGCVRETDICARVGGDEFTFALGDITGPEAAAFVAQRILQSFDFPFQIAGRELQSSASIGIALFPQDASDIEGLLKCADFAMYQAKEKESGAFQFFTSSSKL